jgi:hypothetical protein
VLGRIDYLNQPLEEAAAEFSQAIQFDPDMMRAYEDSGSRRSAPVLWALRNSYEAGALRNREKRFIRNGRRSTSELSCRRPANWMGRKSCSGRPCITRFGWAHYYICQLFQRRGNDAEGIGGYKEAAFDQPGPRQA